MCASRTGNGTGAPPDAPTKPRRGRSAHGCMPPPRLLLLASTIAPSRVIGGRRADRLAAHFARAGWQVTLLTLREAYVPPIDPTLYPPSGCEIVRTHGWMPRAWLRAVRNRGLLGAGAGPRPETAAATTVRATREPTWRRGLERVLRTLEEPDEFAGWRRFALAAVRGRTFEVVVTTVPPPSSLAIAAEIAQRSSARLVLDYRDPWSEQSPDDARDRHRRTEDALLDRADLVVGVTPDLCASLAARTNSPVELVTNGYEGSPFERFAPPRLDPARIVYAGSLAYGRDLEPILRAIASLRPAIGAQQLRVDYAGPHGAGVRAQADRLGVADALVDHGELPAAQANGLLRGALAGIVLVSEGFSYAYPGKIFEILGEARPILAVAPENSATARLIANYQLGWTCQASDTAAIAAVLRLALGGQVPTPVAAQDLHVDAVMGHYERLVRRLLPEGIGHGPAA